MKQRDFDGERGAHHVDCSDCSSDLHLLKWDAERDEEPQFCPFCGSEDIWYAAEALEPRTH